ncbi:MAG: hypothetical protein R2685_02570 [Candidatus Nitrosocosmicus sp.]|nr:hypothetical protein [Candidatus Nitrosocosmicus sp.]
MGIKKFKFPIVIAIFISSIILGIILTNVFNSSNGSNISSSPPIDGIECGEMEQLGYHIHVHMDIFINGTHYSVPSLIGITNNCYYWLHTHDSSGIIHVESPVTKNFTLEQFFQIWKNKYNNSEIFNYIENNTNAKLSLYINGKITLNGTKFQDIVFNPHDEITLVVGKPPAVKPTKYDFMPRL